MNREYKYKIGDEVRLKPKTWFDLYCPDRMSWIPYHLDPDMRELFGKTIIINERDMEWVEWFSEEQDEEISTYEPYYKANGIDWYFSEAMIEGVVSKYEVE